MAYTALFESRWPGTLELSGIAAPPVAEKVREAPLDRLFLRRLAVRRSEHAKREDRGVNLHPSIQLITDSRLQSNSLLYSLLRSGNQRADQVVGRVRERDYTVGT